MTTTTASPPIEVYKKIARVMSSIDSIEESGTHSQGWKYSKAEDVEREVRKHMNATGLILIPHMLGYEWKDNRYIIQFKFDLIDSESGDMLSSTWYGESMTVQGRDNYPDDKAINKCATTAQKYFLKRTFLLAGADDADADANDPAPHNHSNGHKSQKVQQTSEAMEQRELNRMRRELFNLLGQYFGDDAHAGTKKTKTTRAGEWLITMAGVDNSSDLTKDQLTDLLALLQSHIDKDKIARPVHDMWMKKAPPAMPSAKELEAELKAISEPEKDVKKE